MKGYLPVLFLLLAVAHNAYARNRGIFSKSCHGQCGEGEGDCNGDSDCLPGLICKQDDWFLGIGKDVCTKSEDKHVEHQHDLKNGGKDCWSSCNKTQGPCEYCGDGFCCRKNGMLWTDTSNGCDGLIGGNNHHACVLPYRVWECDKFPEWLQREYLLEGTDFCEAQWDDVYFSSQPHCNDKVLPTISFYDRSDDNYEADPICTINMNEATEGEFSKLCPGVDSILKSDIEEVWIVYLVHGFAGYSTTPLWYPQHGVGLNNRYTQAGRKLIFGEVYWKDGAEAIFDKVIPPGIVHSVLTAAMGRSATEDRSHLESVAGMLTCGQNAGGIGVGDVAGYSAAASNTMIVGHSLGKLTESIYESAVNVKVNSFCVGHSLGGHICGFTGKTKELDGILALDPAGPIFDNNSEEKRLNKGDAKFVQALHIDAGEFGIDLPVAHQDIYVNRGKQQPYCPGLFTEAGCSHVAFTLWFLPKVLKNRAEGNMCLAHMKCEDYLEAMWKHESCAPYEGEGLEVGLLSDTPTTGNSGSFWLDTIENEDDGCYFTTLSIADDARKAMDDGWNDLMDIDVSAIVEKAVKAAKNIFG